MKYTRKRDGKLEEFNISRITKAIISAFKACGIKDGEISKRLSEYAIEKLDARFGDDGVATVEEIQDIVEETLMNARYHEVARAYILYRAQQQDRRDFAYKMGSADLIDSYIDETSWLVKENANMTRSMQAMNYFISSNVTSNYWLYRIYPPEVRKAHQSGDMHIHDLGILAPYCVGWDLRYVLYNGFPGGVVGKLSSGPPKHFHVALAQAMNMLYTMQGEAAGAQAFASFDTLLAPGIRYDGLSQDEVYQSLQGFFHLMNVPTRVGGQVPFTNITIDMTVPKFIENEKVTWGGRELTDTYGSFQDEVDMFNKALVAVMTAGDDLGRTFSFPIPTYNITEDFNWEVPGFWEMVAKYGIPYFGNFMPQTGLDPEDVRSMCFVGVQKVLWRKDKRIGFTTLQSLYRRYSDRTVETIYNGQWIKVKPIRVNYEGSFFEIKLRTGQQIKVTADHLHPTMNGLKTTNELKVGDKLQFSKTDYDWKGVGSYNFGKLLGLYLAEGSKLSNGIQFSIGEDEKEIEDFLVSFIEDNFGCHVSITSNTGHSKSLFVNCKGIAELIYRYVSPEKAPTKKLLQWWKLSKEALQGLWDGWRLGDGHNQDVYTRSKELAEQGIVIANILGIPVNLREKEMHTEFPTRTGMKKYNVMLYTIHTCKSSNDGGRIFYDLYNYYWVRIESIKEVPNASKMAFCFEVQEGEPFFELPSGLITHNCCHLRTSNKEIRRGGGLFNAFPLTGSIGVVTINLARIGYLARDEDDFRDRLEDQLHIAKTSLIIKKKAIEKYTELDLYPYSKNILRPIMRRYGGYWSNHFLTVGNIGMNEACLNLFGENILSDEGKKLTVKTLNFINDKLAEYQDEEYDKKGYPLNMYNNEATPAEGTCYRLALLDKKYHPDAIVANEHLLAGGAEPFYTNSTQVPVDTPMIDAIMHQDDIQPLYTGGTVLHLYIEDRNPSPEGVKKIVQRVAANTQLPYFTISPTFSICTSHGYLSGRILQCNICGKETEIYSRVVGYYRPLSHWNPGKVSEFDMRASLEVVG